MRNLGNIIKQAQQMQGRLEKMQEEMANLQITGQSGGGLVEVTVNGRQEMKKIRIDPKAVDVNDLEMLEDLIVAAMNDAQNKIQEITRERTNALTGGLNIPGLNMPF
ncbi:MAG: YbaB/EbfC family nucleoid-associated protein [Magnetococcales bacterium]|nr:YbaB/EbfC family nucleoid-associated protein [Magnetococcales bacterium]NGZ27049.1 YbaB/EbfC family nucleoid-associated protein [Magnetococcales bacterium]